jgi:HAD superfamily hydrolase (TIGR01490 family)
MPGTEAAFFDLDKTVIARASMVAFGGPFYREGLISRRTIARALWGQLIYLHLGASEQKLARMRESVLALTKGWHRDKIRRIVAETLEVTVQPIIYQEALDLIAEHRAAGRAVFIVSASPEEIVAPLAGFLGVDRAIASVATVDEDGRYTGEMDVYAYGPFKAEIMRDIATREGIDLAASYAYSDSYTDLPMLEVVGHPVVVNPDRPLQKVARDRDWEVRSFTRPVRLRDRMSAPLPTTPRSAALTGGVVAVGGATLIWWWIRTRPEPPPPPPWWARAARSTGSAVSAIPAETVVQVVRLVRATRPGASWRRRSRVRRGWRAG